MQLKEFSLISPVIESAGVFQAIETAIPIDVIEQTIGDTQAKQERFSQVSIWTSSVFGNCYELMGEQREKVRINKKALQVADNLFPPMPSIQHSDSNLTQQPHH